jgi:hypothetical protein
MRWAETKIEEVVPVLPEPTVHKTHWERLPARFEPYVIPFWPTPCPKCGHQITLGDRPPWFFCQCDSVGRAT